MIDSTRISINFTGGIVSPGKLFRILEIAENSGITEVSFGLRQQLILKAIPEESAVLTKLLTTAGIEYEIGTGLYPNIMSSYPAEEIFIQNTWLSEGVYKDIFYEMETRHRLKVNVCDSNQSFTPLLTGNINWVASRSIPHFWHLFIRFPKTNSIFEWDQLIYTNDIARMSRDLEFLIFEKEESYYGNPDADGSELCSSLLLRHQYNIRQTDASATLPAFNLPYYEGLNRYNNKYWLGIYRRNELFGTAFLKQICQLCLETKIGQLCTTPWKSIIIKGIEEKDKHYWNYLLVKHQVNVRHAANELNFQVEDNCPDALKLKNYLVRYLNDDDTRTFGLCIGIKTRSKSEVFSSILVRRKPVIRIAGLELFYVYDILCAKDYNPNERTNSVFSSNNPRFLLPEQLRCATLEFGKQQNKKSKSLSTSGKNSRTALPVKEKIEIDWVHQCLDCMTIYDSAIGDPEQGIVPGVPFTDLPENYSCSVCSGPSFKMKKINKLELTQPV